MKALIGKFVCNNICNEYPAIDTISYGILSCIWQFRFHKNTTAGKSKAPYQTLLSFRAVDIAISPETRNSRSVTI